jgi:glyoxylase-like metal-dependent hydrolase (beta-lactamase superfamily II)
MPKIDVLMDGYGLGTDQGIIGFCAVVLVVGEKRVLFDSAHVGRRSLLLARLRERGLSPADIDAQVLSHSHWDHVQNVDLFDNAPLLVHPDERRYASRPHENDWATPKWTGAILESLPIVEVGEGYEVMPGCRVIELAGHSAGSIGLEVETDDGRCLIVGDALPNARAALTGNISFIFWNEARAMASAKRIATSGAAVYPGHDRPFRLNGGDVQYLTDYRLQVNGVGPETPGARFVAVPPAAPSWVMPGIETQRLA